jgi:hypothetical protein
MQQKLLVVFPPITASGNSRRAVDIIVAIDGASLVAM